MRGEQQIAKEPEVEMVRRSGEPGDTEKADREGSRMVGPKKYMVCWTT